uniref:Uncharacterized protein n=1 Tax=viral metagenome TaxID=1070528 RepID=A0A6C0AEV1_9ZZZZ
MEEYILKLKNIAIKNNLIEKCDYNANNIFMSLYTFYFHLKYDTQIFKEDPFFINIDNINFIKPLSNYLNNNDLVFINLFIPNLKHNNLLIYRKNKNILEHYEPNGVLDIKNQNIIDYKIEMFVKSLNKFLPELKIVKSFKLHGFLNNKECYGLQSCSQGHNSEKGYCQIWCYLLTDLILKFPNISTEEIILHLDDKNYQRKKFQKHLKEIIRGFYYYSLQKILKFLNIKEIIFQDKELKNIFELVILKLNI